MMNRTIGAVTVRPARVSDADEIARLIGHLGYEADASTTASSLARILQRPDHRFLVAELEGRPVGWVHAAVWEFVDTGAFALIGGLVVDRAFRGNGIGRLLLRQAEAWAVEQGCSIVRLWSSIGRKEAHRFYERLGYVNVKTQHAFARSLGPAGRRDFGDLVPRLES